MKIRDRFSKIQLPWWGSLVAAVLLAGCITLLALWCQPNALRTVLAHFKAQPLLIVLNAMPIGLLVLAFTSKKSRAPKAEGIPYDKARR